MKKLLTSLSIFIHIAAIAQIPGNGDIVQFLPYQTQRVHVSDSVQLSFIMLANTTVTSITMVQQSGVKVLDTPAVSYFGNGAMATFWKQGLPAGGYSWYATGLTASGAVVHALDSIYVVADYTCPVCPVCPAPRTVSSFTFTLTVPGIPAISLTIPASGLQPNSIKFKDGTTQ